MPQHVLLLRHCFRSTSNTVKVCDKDNANSERNVNITEYIDAPMPDYGVPPMWCLDHGMDIIKATGTYIVDHILFPNSSTSMDIPNRHVTIRMVSDTSLRDSDTAFALSNGMAARLLESPQQVSFEGLDTILYHPGLFKPEKSPYDTRAASPLCPRTEYTTQDVSNQVRDQLNNLDPTQVQKAIDLLQRRGAVSQAWDPEFWNRGECPGEVGLGLGLLLQAAELLFYSRAGRIPEPFVPDMTFEEVYEILQVADIIRSMKRVDNVKAAKNGLVLAKSVLHAFQQQQQQQQQHEEVESNIIKVTIFVGHDTDIDHLATALGLRWELSKPYKHDAMTSVSDDGTNIQQVATPPGSGIIFSKTDPSDTISMQYLFPTQPTGGNIGEDFRLAPVWTTDSKQSHISSIEEFRQRLDRIFMQYPLLRHCFETVPTFPRDLEVTVADSMRGEVSSTTSVCWGLLAINFAIVVGLLAALVLRRRRQHKHIIPPEAYESVTVQTHEQMGLEIT